MFACLCPGSWTKHSLRVGKGRCKLFSRILDERSGYLQRNAKRYNFAEIHFSGNGEGPAIYTNEMSHDTWGLVLDEINYDTLRDILWAIRSLTTTDGFDISEMYLGYDCKIPLRVSMLELYVISVLADITLELTLTHNFLTNKKYMLCF